MIPARLLDHFKESISSERKAFLDLDALLVFTCGAVRELNQESDAPQESDSSKESEPNQDSETTKERGPNEECELKKKSVRATVMKYVDRYPKGFWFFEAEDYFEALSDISDTDLLSAEEGLADFSDCILLFLESPGAYTELGAFTSSDKLAKIILAVNDAKHRGSKSFISGGPLAKIDKLSRFKPTVFVDFEHVLTAMPEIEERLSKIKRQRRQVVDFSDYEMIKQERMKLWMLYLHDIIYFLSPLTHPELISFLQHLYGDLNFKVSSDLALLRALGMICIIDDSFYISTPITRTTFFSFEGINHAKFRGQIVSHYFKRDRDRFKLLRNRNVNRDGV